MPFSSRCNLCSSSRCDLRPSPALFSQPPRKINTKAPPHTPLRAHNTQAHPSQYTRRGTRARARRSTPRSTSSPTSSSPETPTHHAQVCPRPCRQPRALLSVGPAAVRARERPVHMLQAHARPPLPRLPQLRARREARRPPRATQLALAIGTCRTRARRLACFADDLRVAPPVQAAAAASGRARRSPRPRHLRHDRQAQCRQHGQDDPAAVTPGAKPVPVNL